MNKTYYKGDLICTDDFNEDKNMYLFSIDYLSVDKKTKNLKFDVDIQSAISDDEANAIRNIVLNSNNKEFDITDKCPNLYLSSNFEERYSEDVTREIIFEKITDKFGNSFGKELYTGLIFPIIDFSKNVVKKEILFTEDHYTEFHIDFTYEVTFTPIYEGMDLCGCFIDSDYEIADINEVNGYLEVKKHKRKLKKEIKEITELANKNVFNYEIIPMVKQEVKREKQNELTIIMENIEFLLEKLGTINNELKDKYEKEYNLLLESGEEKITNNPLNKISLSQLEGKIEYAISYSRTSSSDIVSYLENLKKEYLNNFILGSNNKTSITLQEIDKLNELFLKMKSSYNLKLQREVIRNISFIYLMEVYENINIISKEELQNSYFIDNRKSIIIAIQSLIRLGLIENNIIIDYNSNFTIEEMLDIISKIEFKQNSENKGYTKILERKKCKVMSKYL